jgi:hypothetical protein
LPVLKVIMSSYRVCVQAGAAAAADLLAAAAAEGGGGAQAGGSEGGSEGGSGATAIGPVTRYYMKRVNSNVVHVLFFVVDDEGHAQLAVVVSDRTGPCSAGACCMMHDVQGTPDSCMVMHVQAHPAT